MRLASKIVIIGLALWLAAAMLFFLNASQACLASSNIIASDPLQEPDAQAPYVYPRMYCFIQILLSNAVSDVACWPIARDRRIADDNSYFQRRC